MMSDNREDVKALSDDAVAIARGLFAMGVPGSTVSFRRPHIIHPRTLAALEELTKAGFLVSMDKDDLPRGARGWAATKLMDRPMSKFPAVKDGKFPITTE
jgi:hypothetical protein